LTTWSKLVAPVEDDAGDVLMKTGPTDLEGVRLRERMGMTGKVQGADSALGPSINGRSCGDAGDAGA
jgi:hypothetical protein